MPPFDKIAPAAVVPFALDRDGARTALRAWAGSRWFAPGRLKKVTRAETMTSTYVPHWAFGARTVSDYVGRRGEHHHVTPDGQSETRRSTRWYPAAGRVTRDFTGLLVGATGQVDGERLTGLGPWPLEQAVALDPAHVAGHHSLPHDIEPEAALEVARSAMAEVVRRDCRRDIGGDEQRLHHVNTRYAEVTAGLVLLPVWAGGYVSGGRTYQVLVNGVSGEVRGDRPYSGVKIVVAGVATLALIAAFVWLYLMNRA